MLRDLCLGVWGGQHEPVWEVLYDLCLACGVGGMGLFGRCCVKAWGVERAARESMPVLEDGGD